MQPIDALDEQIVQLMRQNGRIGIVELARRLDVARATVQARLDKMIKSGVITGFGPDLDLDALGYSVKAFITVEVTHGQIDSVVTPLGRLPEVVEVHSVAGQGDLLCQVACRSNQHLMEVLEQILTIPDVARTSTAIVLKPQVPRRNHQLMTQLVTSE